MFITEAHLRLQNWTTFETTFFISLSVASPMCDVLMQILYGIFKTAFTMFIFLRNILYVLYLQRTEKPLYTRTTFKENYRNLKLYYLINRIETLTRAKSATIEMRILSI